MEYLDKTLSEVNISLSGINNRVKLQRKIFVNLKTQQQKQHKMNHREK